MATMAPTPRPAPTPLPQLPVDGAPGAGASPRISVPQVPADSRQLPAPGTPNAAPVQVWGGPRIEALICSEGESLPLRNVVDMRVRHRDPVNML